jgi:ankyrin repeat protein
MDTMAFVSDFKAGASGMAFEPSIPGVDDFLVASREMLPLMQANSSFAQPPDTVHATPLHAVAVNGDRSQLTSLITSGVYDLDCGDQYGRTPLVYSVLGDRLDCAEVLLKAGAQVNMADMDGRTALHWAAYQDNFRCLRLLLSKGANWRVKDNEGRTALHLATGHQNTKCLKELLRKIKHGSHDINDADAEQVWLLLEIPKITQSSCLTF